MADLNAVPLPAQPKGLPGLAALLIMQHKILFIEYRRNKFRKKKNVVALVPQKQDRERAVSTPEESL